MPRLRQEGATTTRRSKRPPQVDPHLVVDVVALGNWLISQGRPDLARICVQVLQALKPAH